MTNPPSTAGQTPAPKPGARCVWLTRTYQALSPPVHTLIELANAMLADARERGQEEFRADLEKIHASGHVLLTRFQQRLDPPCDADSEVDTLRRLRHDLRTPLTHIIGYCELWLEDAEKFFLDSFVADLREIHNLGKQTLALLDEIVRLVERTGEAAVLPSPPLRGRGERSAARPAPCSWWTTIRIIAISSVAFSAAKDTPSPAPPGRGRP